MLQPRLRALHRPPQRPFLTHSPLHRPRALILKPRLLLHLTRSQSRPLFTAPPTGPLTRLPNRPLPSLRTSLGSTPLYTTLPLFVLILIGSSLAIFNYQKSSSSVIASVLYALRTNAVARRELGGGVYFASRIPWIRGSVNQLHGRVDVRFWVKGDRGVVGEVRFLSTRDVGRGKERANFVTRVWELRVGERVWDLLEGEEGEVMERAIEGGVGAVELADGRIAAP